VKRKGRHPEKALSAVQIRSLSTPGRYADGNGLYLVVERSGSKRWILRTIVNGRRRDMGLGGLSLVTLGEAREKALTNRKLAREGGDPLAERRKARAVVPTFAKAAEIVHAEHKVSWKNPKHAAQWLTTIRQYAFPVLGDRRVDQIDTPDILKVLSPIWATKSETARRVRQRVGAVLDWAKAAGFRSGDNPVDGVAKGLPRQKASAEHHRALPYEQVPQFVKRLRASGNSELVRLAFEFLILTASRTNEALGAQWNEFDFAAKLWTVPPERMKAQRQHRVPLGRRAVEILNRAREIGGGSEFVFPGRVASKPLSSGALSQVVRRKALNITAHGFRSSFRDWAAEVTSYPRELAEMALAHTIESKVEAAYRRGDLLERRRALMQDWADYCAGQE